MLPARTVMQTTGSITQLGPQRACSAALSKSGTTLQKPFAIELKQSREVLLMCSDVMHKTFFSSKLSDSCICDLEFYCLRELAVKPGIFQGKKGKTGIQEHSVD